MTLKFELLRPDDLLSLQIETENLRLDLSTPDDPVLALEDPARPGFLIVGFPPQSIAEEAYFESSPTQPPESEKDDPYNDAAEALPNTPNPVFPSGARMSGGSRLVFRIPSGSPLRIPASAAGLLDWTRLELSVSPLADLPEKPTPQQAQNAPPIAPPTRLETAIELPYRLTLSPSSRVAWLNNPLPKTAAGQTELWHTRLALLDEDGNSVELSPRQMAALRAIWSPDFNPNKFKATDQPLFQDEDPDWPGAITAMAVSDRHDIVVLTSAFHGFVNDEVNADPYQPEPIYAERLMLSALGGWLRSKGAWDPPIAYRFRRPRWQDIDRVRWGRDLVDLLPLRGPFGAPEGTPAGPNGGNGHGGGDNSDNGDGGGDGDGAAAILAAAQAAQSAAAAAASGIHMSLDAESAGAPQALGGPQDESGDPAAAGFGRIEVIEDAGGGRLEVFENPETGALGFIEYPPGAAPHEIAPGEPGQPADAEPAADPAAPIAAGLPILEGLDLALQGAKLSPHLLGEFGYQTNLSEWTHIATQGRDHFVRIVYEGHLYPFGHRAALIKVSERMVRDQKDTLGRTQPVAYLVQHMYIVVRQPERNYEEKTVADLLENKGRGLPFRKIRLTTLVTPNIAHPFPPKNGPCPPNTPHLCGTNDSFWVRLGSGASAADDFKFHAIAEDRFGHTVNFTASLIFVPFSETERDDVAQAYRTSGDERICPVPAQKLTFAPPLPDANGIPQDNTTLAATALYFDTHPVGGPIKQTAGFMPKLAMAAVNLPAVEAMLGKPAATNIAFAPKYLADDDYGGPANATGLFAQVVKEAAPGQINPTELVSAFSADQAGGFATPDLAISGLTGKLGPQAGSLDKIAQNSFDAADFFGKVAGSAKLFGVLPLLDVLADSVLGVLDDSAPKLDIKREPQPAGPGVVKEKIIASIDWKPPIPDKDRTAGILIFHPRRGGTRTVLEVTGRMEQTIELPPPVAPTPGFSKMEGSLTDFTIELAHVVEVLFKRFGFTSQTGSQLSVAVELDPGQPVRFIDDLQFVDELRKQIPPDLFGDGPSLDISFERIKAGFSLALPPVALGVFALRDVTIGAFIELPFVSGLPLFDFAFCSRERPFNLTVSFLGGGGFFHLQIDTIGVKMLEAALEFGASASIDLGVASGGVHIMAGIYFSMQRKTIGGNQVMVATLAGYLRLGGELSVLGLISVSLEFYLCFAYEIDKNAAYGIATLTVKVEVLFFSTSVEITVEKRFGGTSGDPVFLDTFTTSDVWDEYAGAFA